MFDGLLTQHQSPFVHCYELATVIFIALYTSGLISFVNCFSLVNVSPSSILFSQFNSTLSRAWVAHEFAITWQNRQKYDSKKKPFQQLFYNTMLPSLSTSDFDHK